MISFDPYILSIFNSFCLSKQQIMISCYYLSKFGNKGIVDLIMHNISAKDDNDLQRNLFKAELIHIFIKLKHLTLITRHQNSKDKERSLSMDSLLDIIKIRFLKTIVVLSYGWDNKRHYSWMTTLWQTSSSSLIDKYQKSNYEIHLEYKIGPKNKYHGFVITRK